MIRKQIKRFFDVIISMILLLITSPIMVMIIVFIFVKLGKPVFFKQKRPGLNGKLFYMYKLRTMTNHKDKDGNLLPDNIRLTKFGRFLRSTSLDELPELINVIKGDMSLVGPRPLLIEYLTLYSAEQMRRHEMRPGITGWAQVNGRNTISWDDKFKLDVWYIDNWSLGLDAKILFMTLIKVFKREGITQEGHATIEPFRGSGPLGGDTH